jgi:hypothetical protein
MALTKRLRVRIDFADAGQRRFVGQEMLMDAQQHFTTHLERRAHQQIEGAADRAVGRILDRHDRIIGVAGFDLAQYVVD